MRDLRSTFILALALMGCAKGPLHLAREDRILEPGWVGMKGRVQVTSASATDGKSLYFGTDSGWLFAVEVPESKLRWKRHLGGRIDGTPLASDGRLLVGTATGKFLSLDSSTGQTKWEREISGEILGQPRILDGNLVLVGANDGTLYALDRETGSQAWKYSRALPDRITVHGFSAPAISSGKVYAAFPDGYVVALDSKTGAELWKRAFPLKGKFADIVAPIETSDQGTLVAQFFGDLFSVDAKGEPTWSMKDAGGGSPALISDKQLIVASVDSRIISTSVASGAAKWTFKSKENVTWSGTAVLGKYLLASTFDGWLYVLDYETGEYRWRYQFGSAILGPPVIQGSQAWVITRRGTIYTLEIRTNS